MPTWVRHKTGSRDLGFWRGSEETFADNCSMAEKTAIENAFQTLTANATLASCFPRLKQCMDERWPNVPVDCCFDDTRPPRDGDLQAFIFICNMDGRGRQVEILRGLTKLCGGKSLDVRAAVFAVFGAPEGVPVGNELNEFLNEPTFAGNPNEREGEFVVWNRQTGEVFEKTTGTRDLGFWRGSVTTTSKGARCFQDGRWQI